MKFQRDIQFTSQRLHFEIVSDQYVQDIFRELTPEVAKFLPFVPTGKIEDTYGFVSYSLNQLKKGEDITFVVLDRETNSFVGCCGIHEITSESASLGIWLKESASGKGLGTELIEALEDYANEILSVDCLIYNVDKNNKGSIKIAEKLGFVYHKSFLRKVSEEKVLDMLQYVKSTN